MSTPQNQPFHNPGYGGPQPTPFDTNQGFQQAGYGQPQHPVAPQYQMQQPYYGANGLPLQPKSKVAAALLAFFLGTFGAHNFYLGYTSRAIVQLVVYLFGWATSWLLIGLPVVMGVGIWAFVEFIMIIAGAGKYRVDANGVPTR